MADPIINVSVGVIIEENRCLISRRREGTHLAGLWEFPGGKLSPGETAEDCLYREIREELGIGITIDEVLPVIEHTYPERTVRLHFFKCSPIPGEDRISAGSSAQWIPLSELGQYRFPEANLPILKLLRG